jgi:hypothetical protein
VTNIGAAKCNDDAGQQWLTPVILATQEAKIRRIIQSQPWQFVRPYLKNNHHRKGMVEWLKL